MSVSTTKHLHVNFNIILALALTFEFFVCLSISLPSHHMYDNVVIVADVVVGVYFFFIIAAIYAHFKCYAFFMNMHKSSA